MDRNRLLVVFTVLVMVLSLAFFGCKGRVEKMPETEMAAGTATEEMAAPIVEPAQTVATETIPPTAAPELDAKAAPAIPAGTERDKEIQRALKNAGFYTGAIDGRIGPKTKQAIIEFQKSKGLKADGKAGPRTWAELEKYLTQ